MKNYRIWPIAVLVIVGLIYFWDDEDRPESEETAQQQIPPVSLSTPQEYQAPQTQSWVPPGNYPPPNYPYTQQPQEYGIPGIQTFDRFTSPGGMRFRPEQERTVNGYDYDFSYPSPRGRGYPMTTQQPTLQDPYGYQSYPQTMDNYRFRPLDKQRQERRWQGNYGQMPDRQAYPTQPYPYAPGPTYPSRSTDSKSLWANSWEER